MDGVRTMEKAGGDMYFIEESSDPAGAPGKRASRINDHYEALDLGTSKHDFAKRASAVQKTENELSRPIRFQPLHHFDLRLFILIHTTQ